MPSVSGKKRKVTHFKCSFLLNHLCYITIKYVSTSLAQLMISEHQLWNCLHFYDNDFCHLPQTSLSVDLIFLSWTFHQCCHLCHHSLHCLLTWHLFCSSPVFSQSFHSSLPEYHFAENTHLGPMRSNTPPVSFHLFACVLHLCTLIVNPASKYPSSWCR